MVNIKRGIDLTKEELLIAMEHNKSLEKENENTVRVAIYGRVSTDHEAQLYALENQMQWYEEEVAKHKNWVVIDRYIDEGVSGTKVAKRDDFQRMIADARLGKFDLVVTREMCRFARNIEEGMHYVEKLRSYFIEVYFVSDNAWSFDPHSILKMGLLLTLAQDESRKISERCRAGQATSRSKGVLYGNGNILGYKRDGKTYAIVNEEAEVVRDIFEWYINGLSCTAIARQLEANGREDACGKVKWSASKISRILNRTTYMGYMSYNQSKSDGYLTQKRVTVPNKERHQVVKVDIPIIIDEATWYKAEKIRNSKLQVYNNTDVSKRGKKKVKNLWCGILLCSCGHSFRRDKWRTSVNGTIRYGYRCYRQINEGTKSAREKAGLPIDDVCTTDSIPDWKLDYLGKKVIEQLWVDRGAAVEKAYDILKECYESEDETKMMKLTKNHKKLKDKLEKLETRLKGYREMRADGELSKEEYLECKEEIEKEISQIKDELETFVTPVEPKCNNLNNQLGTVKRFFNTVVDFSKEVIEEEVIKYCIKRVLVKDYQTYEVDVNFEGLELVSQKEIPSTVERILISEYDIDYNEARKYVKSRDGFLRVTQWPEDMHIKVNLLVDVK